MSGWVAVWVSGAMWLAGASLPDCFPALVRLGKPRPVPNQAIQCIADDALRRVCLCASWRLQAAGARCGCATCGMPTAWGSTMRAWCRGWWRLRMRMMMMARQMQMERRESLRQRRRRRRRCRRRAQAAPWQLPPRMHGQLHI